MTTTGRSPETTVDTFTASSTVSVASSALPHSRVTVLIELRSETSTVRGHPLRAVSVGLQREPVDFTLGGPVDCVEIRLLPSMALQMGLDVGELCGDLAPVDRLFGRRSHELAEQLAVTAAGDRARLIRRALFERSGRTASSPAIEWIRHLEDADVSQTIGSIVSEIGTSRGTLWRNATAALGMSPKEYLMLRRFELGVDLVRAGHPIARAAADAGYVDQAHFHRHVKRCAQRTPGRLQVLDARENATFVQEGDTLTPR